MNFDSLYKTVLEEKNNCKNPCLICYREATNDNIKLKCKHYFHRKCIIDTKNKNKISFNFECPYCKTVSRIYNKKSQEILSSNKDFTCKEKKICIGIIKTGNRKGLQCTHIAKNGDYCKKHLPKTASLVI